MSIIFNEKLKKETKILRIMKNRKKIEKKQFFFGSDEHTYTNNGRGPLTFLLFSFVQAIFSPDCKARHRSADFFRRAPIRGNCAFQNTRRNGPQTFASRNNNNERMRANYPFPYLFLSGNPRSGSQHSNPPLQTLHNSIPYSYHQ